LVLRLDLRISAQPFPNRGFIVNEPLSTAFKFVARPLVSAPSVPREPDRDLNNDVCSTRFEDIVSDSVSVLRNEVCSARFEDIPNEPDNLLAKPSTSEPAKDNEPVRVLESEM
jgi:hypothetical protein